MTWHPGYATVAEVARIYQLTPAQVYRRASKNHWRRYTLDGRVRYHRFDVEATLRLDITRLKGDRDPQSS